MERFTIIDDEAAILTARGVLRQVRIFKRGDDLYAAHGNGFLGLRKDGQTSVPHIRWLDISVDYEVGHLGRLVAK